MKKDNVLITQTRQMNFEGIVPNGRSLSQKSIVHCFIFIKYSRQVTPYNQDLVRNLQELEQ